MMGRVIKAEGLGKWYSISRESHEPYGTLRDAITGGVKRLMKNRANPLRRGNGQSISGRGEGFWALRDVSFEVSKGERIGIIGRNGAGKTTLLKILSRITEPTEGRARIRGRVSSLLEVGTGFHPELTGRENIFLNGAILGMRGREIRNKFDEIVEFAEVERFLDMPVKRYSSGMYVRLAFAVAAHLDPDILLVDEVLAVGDAGFQKKCIGKMREVGREGRTILFVSHNMAAVESTCEKAIIIKDGQSSKVGNAKDMIGKYLEDVKFYSSLPLGERVDRNGRGNIRFTEIQLEGREGDKTFEIGEDIVVTMRAESSYSMDVHVRLALSIRTQNDVPLISCDSIQKAETYCIPARSGVKITCTIPRPPLNVGEYYINVALFNGDDPEDWVTSAANLSIASGTYGEFTRFLNFPVLSEFTWAVEE
jgi:lipopolysaccharide transport system ATP-binding protein